MNYLEITIFANESEHTICLNDFFSIDEAVKSLNEDIKKKSDKIDPEEIEVIDWQGVPECFQSFPLAFELAEAYQNSSYDLDVFEAAHECDVDLNDIDEAYSGVFKDNEDFAYNTAEQLSAIDKNASWPNKCIDWKHAAKELMLDYSESNGHYFRNL